METEKIRCKDLCVGDWVANRNGSPMQIVAVDEDNAYACEGNEERPWIFGDDEGYEPQPIEITYELLEANGWKALIDEYAEPCHLGCVYESNSVLLEWDKPRKILTIWCDWIKGNRRRTADIIIPCKYIHQIQQVLRIAGMTDLANNFKI